MSGRSSSDPPGGPAEGGSRRRVIPLLLASLVLLALFLGLEPLLTFGAWGSDSGEYALLTSYLLHRGSFWLNGYTGWGFGYPYFPGTFEVGAGIAAATGADPLLSLEIAIPALAALGVAPAYLLFRRLLPSDAIALAGAALTAVASPRLLVISHAAPQSLGDLLWIASLWGFVAQRKDPRWWVLVAISSAALILSHHLSSYFFLLSALGLVVVLELYEPRRWSVRFPWPELLFLGLFTTGLFAYWELYAPAFGRVITAGLLGGPAWLVPAGALGVLVVAGALIQVRRAPPWRSSGGASPKASRALWRIKWPTERRVLRDGLVLGGVTAVGVGALFVVALPGTGDHATIGLVEWYLPLLLFIPLAAGMKGLLPATRLGPGAFALLIAIGLSALFAVATSNTSIPADRHPEFLIPPLALVVGASVGRVLALPPDAGERWRWWGALLLLGVLVGANAAVAYPPPSVLEGFQEGFTPADLAVGSWSARELAPGSALASDHRLSDLYFYDSGGSPATWDNATCLFEGNDSLCARAELALSYLPNPPLTGPVDAVAVDATMQESGVALNPSLPAIPMSAPAIARLHGPGFVELYVAGAQAVWWVDTPLLPPG